MKKYIQFLDDEDGNELEEIVSHHQGKLYGPKRLQNNPNCI